MGIIGLTVYLYRKLKELALEEGLVSRKLEQRVT